MNRKVALIILQIVITLSLQAQVRYFMQADANLPLLSKTTNKGVFANEFSSIPEYTQAESTSKFEKRIGFNVKGGLQYEFSKKWRLDGTLQFSQLNYRQQNVQKGVFVRGSTLSAWTQTYYGAGYGFPENPATTGPIPVTGPVFVDPKVHGNPDKQGVVNIGILSVGGTLKYSVLPKTFIGLGAAVNALVMGTGYNTTYQAVPVTTPNGPGYRVSTHITKAKSSELFNQIGASANFNIEQQISPRISIEASLVQFLNKIYKSQDNELDGKKAHMRFASIGVRYYLN